MLPTVPIFPALRRAAPLAAVVLAVAGGPKGWAAQQTESTQPAAAVTRLHPRQVTPETQSVPAPVVRPRPRTQASVPVQAPPDAAPLVTRAPRPRPINPQDLSGVPAATGTSTIPASRPRPATATGVQGATGTRSVGAASGAAGHSGTQALPHSPLAGTAPVGSASGTTAARPTVQRPPVTGGPTASTGQGAGSTPAAAPKLSATGLNRTVIVLDPAHGGTDSGSRIGDNSLEKDVTLALALRLRSLLTARGFTVVLTRDSDVATEGNTAATPLTLDDRAGIANHARAAACLLLHATGRGDGLHLYTSELEPAAGEAAQLPWLTAQAAWVPASQSMERSVSTALGRSHIALVSSLASIRPVDSLACPAMVVELAPENGDVKTVNDTAYQDRIAAAIAGALVFWQNQVQAPPKLSAAPTAPRTPRHRTPSTGANPTIPREAQP